MEEYIGKSVLEPQNSSQLLSDSHSKNTNNYEYTRGSKIFTLLL